MGKGKGKPPPRQRERGWGDGNGGGGSQLSGGEQNETKNPKISQCVYWLGGGKGGGVQNKRRFGSITIHQAVRTARDTLSHIHRVRWGGRHCLGGGGDGGKRGARAGRGPHSFLHGHTHSGGYGCMCVCCREPWGRGAGEGAVQGKGPGAGSDPSGPFGGGWKGEGRGQHEVSLFPPPHAHTPCARCWSTSAGEGAVGGGGVLPIE